MASPFNVWSTWHAHGKAHRAKTRESNNNSDNDDIWASTGKQTHSLVRTNIEWKKVRVNYYTLVLVLNASATTIEWYTSVAFTYSNQALYYWDSILTRVHTQIYRINYYIAFCLFCHYFRVGSVRLVGKRGCVCANVCFYVVVFSYVINWNFVLVRVMRAVVSVHVYYYFFHFCFTFVFVAVVFLFIFFLFLSTLFDIPLNWLLIFLCKHTQYTHMHMPTASDPIHINDFIYRIRRWLKATK